MDKELKAKWVAALRSGEYVQGHGRLRDVNDHYCCIGVLCKLMGLYVMVSSESLSDPRINDLYHKANEVVGDSAPLWKRNDGCAGHKRHTFPEIADYIEANL